MEPRVSVDRHHRRRLGGLQSAVRLPRVSPIVNDNDNDEYGLVESLSTMKPGWHINRRH